MNTTKLFAIGFVKLSIFAIALFSPTNANAQGGTIQQVNELMPFYVSQRDGYRGQTEIFSNGTIAINYRQGGFQKNTLFNSVDDAFARLQPYQTFENLLPQVVSIATDNKSSEDARMLAAFLLILAANKTSVDSSENLEQILRGFRAATLNQGITKD
jgi:hypothetical protein